MMPRLSPRQHEIITLKCRDDLTTEQVGDALCLSPMTIKNHITIILQKFGARSMNGVCFRCKGMETARFERVIAMRHGDL